MKRAILGLACGAALGFAHGASAADLGSGVFFQPGPAAYSNWSGFYFGGQGGFSHADITFGSGSNEILNGVMASGLPGGPQFAQPTATAFRDSADGATFGGFVGYNTQWEEAILGFELNYNHAEVKAGSSQIVPLALPNIGVGGLTASARLTDYGTVRVRGGWVLGRFLPYAMLGLALGHMDFNDAAMMSYTPVIAGVPQGPLNISTSADQSAFGIGWAAGLGLDVMVTSNIFLRAEYEFVQFTSVGQPDVGSLHAACSPNLIPVGAIPCANHELTLNTIRGAIAVRF
jgi:opacity protein-like surface antigen